MKFRIAENRDDYNLAEMFAQLVTWFVVLTVALWIVVAAVAVSNSRQLSQQQIRVRPV